MIIYRSDWLALGGETTVKMVLLFLFSPHPFFYIFMCPLWTTSFYFFMPSCEYVCMCHCCLRPPFRVIVVGCVISQRDDTWVSVSVSFPPRRALLQLVSGDLSLLPLSPTTPLFLNRLLLLLIPLHCVWVCVSFLENKDYSCASTGRSVWIMLRASSMLLSFSLHLYLFSFFSLSLFLSKGKKQHTQRTHHHHHHHHNSDSLILLLCRCVMYQNVPVAPSYLE